MKHSLFLLLCVVLAACNQQPNKFSDPIRVKIADFQDRRLSDSLYQYFKDKNPAYRKDAVLAFASIQDTVAIDSLHNVLRFDTEPNVRKVAAIALGQISTNKSAIALSRALAEEKDPVVLKEIIESCGKTLTRKNIGQLSITTTDEQMLSGLAWAYFRMGIRREADSTLVPKAAEFLDKKYSLSTRLGAVSFLARSQDKSKSLENSLATSAQQDESPWVRATATTALKRINTSTSIETIKKILKNDSDYRVRISAVRAFQDLAFENVKNELYHALNDSNINVAIAAAEVIRDIGTSFEAAKIEEIAKKATHWRVNALLYETILLVLNDKRIAEEVVLLYNQEQNPYAKAAFLTALGNTTHAWRFIERQLHESKIPVIKSSAASALTVVNSNNQFTDSLKVRFVQVYIKGIQTGDAAVIGTLVGALTNPFYEYYKNTITDFSFLYEARKKLSLPKDNEAIQPLEAAIAYFENRKESPSVKNEFNHPIDWDLVKTIRKDQKVNIKTSKGDIIIKLLVEEAPGSVANFVDLINKKYFDSKNFHRVVPNFVIQGGCNRGDGWGSEDYSIRSEFSDRHYSEGSVGMASAGKDTEGTQWFITHSPTPHLDGRYTIFAETVSGMDVVHKIEVGDIIESVTLIK